MSLDSGLSSIRQEYARETLSVHDVQSDPIAQFNAWFAQVQESGVPEPNAMVLATATPDGKPSARVVLLKGVDARGFSFYTNHESRKSEEINDNPQVSLVFHWLALERQVRIEGIAEKLAHEESASYFAERPRGSRLGAWASPQSKMIASREVLEERLAEVEKRFNGRDVPCPTHWGGYVVRPHRIEFWQGRPSRLHDRVVFDRADGDTWTISRLAP